MNIKIFTIIVVILILLLVIIPFVLFLIPLFKNTNETYTDSDITPLTSLPTPPIPTGQNLLLSDKDGNLNIVNSDAYNKTLTEINTDLTSWANDLNQYVKQRLDAMQQDLDNKISYGDSIALAFDHSRTEGTVPKIAGGSPLYALPEIDKDPTTRQYFTYTTTDWKTNIFSGGPLDLKGDGNVSPHQSSNFKIIPGITPGQPPPQ